MKIGVIDLISYKNSDNFYSKLLQPLMTSLMPQVIATWLEEDSHSVFYHIQIDSLKKAKDLKQLPSGLDLVFISSYSINAYLAYSLAKYYKKQGTITILGGPHARSYSKDSSKYFNIVVKHCNQELIQDIVNQTITKNIDIATKGLIMDSPPCENYPSVEKRMKFITKSHTMLKWLSYKPIPLLTSIGCGRGCEFCIDGHVQYKSLIDINLYDDLCYLANTGSKYLVLIHDPNLGFNLKKLLSVLSKLDLTNLRFIAELSLNRLSPSICEKLRDCNFIGLGPGLESWNSYNDKSISNATGIDKVREVSEQVKMITSFVPAMQLNLLFGLDSDCKGTTHFDLTREFIRTTPEVYTNFQTLTMFGDSTPLRKKYLKDRRILNVPYNLLDGFTVSNIRLLYDPIEFYRQYASLVDYSCNWKNNFKKIMKSKTWLVKLYYVLQSINGRLDSRDFWFLSNQIETNSEFHSFFLGDSKLIPVYYKNLIKTELGIMYQFLKG